MICLVDAGPLVKVEGASPRDCASLAILEADARTKFPIDVYLESGDVYRFIETRESEPGEDKSTKERKPNARASVCQKKTKPAAR